MSRFSDWFTKATEMTTEQRERQAALHEMRVEADAYMDSIRRPQSETDAMMEKIRRENHERYERLVARKIAERRARAKDE